MTVPGNLSSPLLATAAAAAAAGVATKSLRFDSGDSAYLSRTPSSAGNRKTWTWAAWVKRGAISSSSEFCLFGMEDDVLLAFAQDKLRANVVAGSVALTTSQVLRDPSAWYHLVFAIDTTNATANNRVRIYVNGSEITDFSARNNPSQNADTNFNQASIHYIGRQRGADPRYFAGYLADIYFIDGTQLDPTSFGAYNDSGVWQSAAYSGTYGTNGFHLNFSDASSTAALGTDSSGNGNTFTVNNITLNKTSVSSSTITNVAAGNAWNQDKTWSNLVSGPSQGYVGSNPITNGFDGSNSTLANASSAGGTMTFSAALGTGTFNVEMRFGNDQLYNGTTIDGVAPTSTSVSNTIGHWTGLTSFNVMTMNSTGLANNARCCWNWIKVNGKFLVDSGNSGDPGGGPPDLTIANTTNFSQLAVHDVVQTNVSITAIDSSTSKISVSGGSWEGSNGSGTSGGDTTVSTVAVTTGDDVVDVPTNDTTNTDSGAGGEISGNYAVLNPLNKHTSNNSFTNGNLHFTTSGSDGGLSESTIAVSSGKFYFEVVYSRSGQGQFAGIRKPGSRNYNNSYIYTGTANKYTNGGSGAGYGATLAHGDVIGTAFDADNGTLTFYKNGVSQGQAFSGISGTYSFFVGSFGGAPTGIVNFGASPFSYAAPSGFKALNTASMTAATIADGRDYFDAKLWTGNSQDQRAITGYQFSPDWVWIKRRNASYAHPVMDTVRGLNSGHAGVLYTNATNSEDTGATSSIRSFNSDGFNLGTDGGVNYSGSTYVGWAWDAGSSTVSNTDGSITSSVRANQTAGFSIVSYAGTGSNATVGHGLSTAPHLYIVKNRTNTYEWGVYHIEIGTGAAQNLNYSNNNSVSNTWWNNTAPTNSVFSIGTYAAVNQSSANFIAYCFAPVAGFSAFGKAVGNNSSNGPFVFTGFRPRFIIWRPTASGHSWMLIDTARDTYNIADATLRAQSSNAESHFDWGDVLSNGFKIRNTDTNPNGVDIIWAAWAENPFQANGGLAR